MGTGTLGAFCYLENGKGEVLLVRQNYGKRQWTLPGGRVELKENPRKAAKRELREETGIVGTIKSYIGTYAAPYRNDVVILFAMKAKKFKLRKPNHEIADLGFFSKNALPKPMTVNTKIRLRDAIKGNFGVFRVFRKPGILAKA